jgi:hypothetical protein
MKARERMFLRSRRVTPRAWRQREAAGLVRESMLISRRSMAMKPAVWWGS